MQQFVDISSLGIGKAKREVFENPAYADGWNSAISIIENAQKVDAVQVVRCGKCKKHLETRTDGFVYCKLVNRMLRNDDFCS